MTSSGLTLGLPLRWRHNGRDSVSNHQPHDCLLNHLFRRRSKKTSKLRITGLCASNSPGTAQMASNADNVSIWWRLHARSQWGTSSQRNAVSHRLGATLKSALVMLHCWLCYTFYFTWDRGGCPGIYDFVNVYICEGMFLPIACIHFAYIVHGKQHISYFVLLDSCLSLGKASLPIKFNITTFVREL